MRNIKRKISAAIASSLMVVALVGCGDVKNIKESQLTGEDEKKLEQTLTKEEKSLLMEYKARKMFEAVAKSADSFLNGNKTTTVVNEDLTVNEMLKSQREYKQQK